MSLSGKPLLEAPANTAGYTYETLAYVDAYDAVIHCDYAFVAYKESQTDGSWRVRIKSSQTASAMFNPVIIQSQAQSAGAQGKPFFTWGYSFDPCENDSRNIQFKVHVADGRPHLIEIFVQLRKADGSTNDPQSVSFPWPES